MRGGSPGKEFIIFEYNATKHKHFVNDWFAGFQGTLHCDTDPIFELLFTYKQSSRVITIRIRDENLSLLPWQAKKRLSGGGDGFL
jgi:hypothetical protein